MYCHKCGYRIDPGAAKCPHCGADAARAEVCGGFYGIAGKERPAGAGEKRESRGEDPEKLKKKYEDMLAAQQQEAEMKQKQRGRLFAAALVLAAVFLLFGTFQSFRLGRVKKELEEYRSQDESSAEKFSQILYLMGQIEEDGQKLLSAREEAADLEKALGETEETEETEEDEEEDEPSNVIGDVISWIRGGDSKEEETAPSPAVQAADAQKRQQLDECRARIQVLEDEIEELKAKKDSLMEELGLAAY